MGIFRKYRYDRYEISSILQTKPFIQREQTFAYWDRKYATLPSRIVLSFYRSDSSMLFYKLLKSFNDCRRMPNKQKQKYVLLTLQDPNFCVHDISIVTTETSSLITLLKCLLPLMKSFQIFFAIIPMISHGKKLRVLLN